jgi:hypothetical protein
VLSGYYTLVTPANNALDIPANSTTQGTKVQLYKANNGDAQKFQFSGTGGANNRILAAKSRHSLDFSGASAANGTPLIIWPYTGAANQQFKLLPTGDGWLLLQAANGAYLSAADNSATQVKAGTDRQNAIRFRAKATSYTSWTSGLPALDAKLKNIMDTRIGYDGDLMRKCFNYVVNNHSYIYNGNAPSYDLIPNYANEMIDNGGGNCYRFASLLYMLYQYNGITNCAPIFGDVAGNGPQGHGWLEVYINGQTYVVDPDAQKELPSYNFYMITYGNAPLIYQR